MYFVRSFGIDAILYLLMDIVRVREGIMNYSPYKLFSVNRTVLFFILVKQDGYLGVLLGRRTGVLLLET